MRRVVTLIAAIAVALVATAAPALAADVAIQDFDFDPATVTIEQGDSVTWTNNDAAPHTATADDGSFDTGTLQQGDSSTVTFADPGTFPYFCEIHPFMQGTVEVTPAGGGGAGGADDGGELPQTATPLPLILLGGLALVGAGLWLIRRQRST